jgi:hypothetical protein
VATHTWFFSRAISCQVQISSRTFAKLVCSWTKTRACGACRRGATMA